MTDRIVRVGMIGFGQAGGLLHAPLIAVVPRLRVTRVVTRRVGQVHGRFPDAAVSSVVEEVLDDPDIDLVVVTTPNATHASFARRALEAGKHVVLDKPFVLDPDEGAALIRLARERNRMLSVFHNRRWDGDALTVEDLVRGGRLGRLRLVELRWDRFRPAIKQGWREAATDGGGVLADLGPHLIDQALRLFGPPEAMGADIAIQREAALVDDYFELTLRYGRMRVILSASTLVAAPRPRAALHGDAGSFVKHGLDPQEAHLRAGGSVDDPGFGEDAPEQYGVFTDGEGRGEPIATRVGDWRHFYEGVAAAILDGAPPPVDPADALTGLRLLALARRSAAEGQVLPFVVAP